MQVCGLWALGEVIVPGWGVLHPGHDREGQAAQAGTVPCSCLTSDLRKKCLFSVVLLDAFRSCECLVTWRQVVLDEGSLNVILQWSSRVPVAPAVGAVPLCL